MKMLFRGALALASVALVSGCADLITGGPLIRPGEPTGYIEVANGSSYVIDVVMISNCNASTYGLNRMAEGESIAPGYSYTFEVSAGCWDVGAGSFAGVEAYQRMDIGSKMTMHYTLTD